MDQDALSVRWDWATCCGAATELIVSRITEILNEGGNEMPINNIEADPELQRVLWACYHYCSLAPSSSQQWSICYEWALHQYEAKFHCRFKQSQLRTLARNGFLRPEETSRGGKRRYYAIVDPSKVAELLKEWHLLE